MKKTPQVVLPVPGADFPYAPIVTLMVFLQRRQDHGQVERLSPSPGIRSCFGTRPLCRHCG